MASRSTPSSAANSSMVKPSAHSVRHKSSSRVGDCTTTPPDWLRIPAQLHQPCSRWSQTNHEQTSNPDHPVRAHQTSDLSKGSICSSTLVVNEAGAKIGIEHHASGQPRSTPHACSPRSRREADDQIRHTCGHQRAERRRGCFTREKSGQRRLPCRAGEPCVRSNKLL